MKMKMILIYAAAILAVLAGSTALYAQMGPQQGGGPWGHGPGRPMTAEQRLQRMTMQLSLTDAQQQLIKPILENEPKQMQSLQEDSTLSQQDRTSKMMQIRQGTSEQIKPILNADQQQKYEQMMSRQGRDRSGPGQNQPQGGAPPPPQ
jgi:protein CpxP